MPVRAVPVLILPLLLTLATAASGQERARAWSELRRQLDSGSTPVDQHADRLEAFLAGFSKTAADQRSDEIVAARLRLATVRLGTLDLERARDSFETVLRAAPEGAIDARGAARYGLAQVAELAGDAKRARALYAELAESFTGTRYADFARVALHRLDRPPAERPRVGGPAPDFGSVLDRSGAAHRLADQLGRPSLLLFLDPRDPEALERTAAVVRAARAAKMPDDAMIAFVTVGRSGVEDGALADLATRPEFKMALVPGPDGFLSTPFLRYEVRSLPSTVLVGPDGTILGRDMPARRLREAIAQLQR